jgi:hypothetical protein
VTPVGDNYAPAVSQLFMDAILDDSYLHLPRMKLHVDSRGSRERASGYMSLLEFLFAAGTRSTSQVTNQPTHQPTNPAWPGLASVYLLACRTLTVMMEHIMNE